MYLRLPEIYALPIMDGKGKFLLYIHRGEVEYHEIFDEKEYHYIVLVEEHEGRGVLKEDVLYVFESDIGKKIRIQEAKEEYPEYFI